MAWPALFDISVRRGTVKPVELCWRFVQFRLTFFVCQLSENGRNTIKRVRLPPDTRQEPDRKRSSGQAPPFPGRRANNRLSPNRRGWAGATASSAGC